LLLAAQLASGGALAQGEPTKGNPVQVGPAYSVEQRACAEGATETCFRLGIAYSEAEPRDMVLATVFLAQSCHGGMGCFQLGRLTGSGEGYSSDEGRRIARAWLDCRGKVVSACFDMGETYRNAKTSPRTNNPNWKMSQVIGLTTLGLNAEEAARLCDVGPPTNCAKRAAMSFLGKGAPEDVELALQFLDKGCQRKERTACSLQAEVRAEGILRDRYDDQAVDFYILTVNLDPEHKQALDALDAMGVELMLKTIVPAQR
jgi:TPR repeat protein